MNIDLALRITPDFRVSNLVVLPLFPRAENYRQLYENETNHGNSVLLGAKHAPEVFLQMDQRPRPWSRPNQWERQSTASSSTLITSTSPKIVLGRPHHSI